MTVNQPSYETPSMPTRPLWPRTFLISQSIESYASVPSSIDFGLRPVARWSGHDERPFRLELSAQVLKDENIPVIRQLAQARLQRRPAAIDSIRRPHEKNWQRTLPAFRHENDRVQLDAVAHRDHFHGRFEARISVMAPVASRPPIMIDIKTKMAGAANRTDIDPIDDGWRRILLVWSINGCLDFNNVLRAKRTGGEWRSVSRGILTRRRPR